MRLTKDQIGDVKQGDEFESALGVVRVLHDGTNDLGRTRQKFHCVVLATGAAEFLRHSQLRHVVVELTEADLVQESTPCIVLAEVFPAPASCELWATGHAMWVEACSTNCGDWGAVSRRWTLTERVAGFAWTAGIVVLHFFVLSLT